MNPAYLNLLENGELRRRANVAVAGLVDCVGCARECHVNRLGDAGQLGYCRVGRRAIVHGCFAHHGEEDCIRGRGGSGTIFFSGCNLRCVFCQNYDISCEMVGSPVDARELADCMLDLQGRGCHNVNFVTPSHVVPQILESLVDAAERGLRLPLVYNTGGYDSLKTLRLLDGVIDIYMPDLKFASPEVSERLLNAPDYPKVAKAALKEMHRQVGDLVLDEGGIAQRGLLVRHLVMPNNLAGTDELMRFLATELSPNTFVNVMPQYRPEGLAQRYPEINRVVTVAEVQAAVEAAEGAGLHRFG